MLTAAPVAAGGPPAAAKTTGGPPVATKGIVKVLDLGLARLHSSTPSGELTAPNVLMGTPDYLAPEQIDNAAGVDIRLDLYSLGATLFYLLTGKVPFAHHHEMLAKLKAHGHEMPKDVRQLRPEVPAGVAALVARLLAKRPHQRFATPQELANALAPFTTPAAAPSRPRPRRRRFLVAVACVLLVPLATWATFSLLHRAPRPDTRPAASPDLPVVQQPGVDPAPGPAAAQPLKVLRLDVEYLATVRGLEQPRGLIGRKSLLPPAPAVPETKTTDEAPYAHPYSWDAFVLVGDPD